MPTIKGFKMSKGRISDESMEKLKPHVSGLAGQMLRGETVKTQTSELKCESCGKEYKSEAYYNKHIETCGEDE